MPYEPWIFAMLDHQSGYTWNYLDVFGVAQGIYDINYLSHIASHPGMTGMAEVFEAENQACQA